MNLLGLIVSVLYIFLILFISTKIKKSELSRKIVHIGVSNWWIIVMIFFDNVYLASIVPTLFVILNYISYKKSIFSSIEREGEKSLGTVYYAISCLVLTILTFTYFKSKLYAGIGILVMGYGDGLAAVMGQKIKFPQYMIFKQKKTIAGSLTMFIVSFIVISILTLIYNQFSLLNILIVASISTILEALSIWGTDNLTVPILTSIISFILI